jgi:hypothetical protein
MISALVCFSTRHCKYLGTFVDVSNDIYILIPPTIFVVLARSLYNLAVKDE